MTASVFIKQGTYRNNEIVDTEFDLVKSYQENLKGNYLTVKNNGRFPDCPDNIKIKVADSSCFVISGEITPHVETDEDAMDRIATRFKILDEMAAACIRGDIRAMIVSGPPGVGKSYGVEVQLERSSVFDQLANKRPRYNVVKGAMTALGLYAQLYKYSDKGNILVFDDCDSVFGDELSLNILKAALDSGKRRRICWNSDSRLLRDECIPNSFDYNGSAIFITNLKFSNVRSKKLQDHLEALESRCHFLDLTIDSERDKMLRIKQVHRDTTDGLFRNCNFKNNEDDAIFEFMEQNKDKLRELSIRMALKIADLVKVNENNWQNLALMTCTKRR